MYRSSEKSTREGATVSAIKLSTISFLLFSSSLFLSLSFSPIPHNCASPFASPAITSLISRERRCLLCVARPRKPTIEYYYKHHTCDLLYIHIMYVCMCVCVCINRRLGRVIVEKINKVYFCVSLLRWS